MLPLGDLREPMASAARASCLVVTRGGRDDRAEILAWWARWGSGGPVFWVDFAIGALRRFPDRERLELPAPAPGKLFAFCALGHPDAFYADLLVAGLPWTGTWSFPDHQALGPAQLRKLEAAALASGADGLVCTEKDAVKLPEGLRLSLPLWVAEQRVQGGEPLSAWLLEQLDRIAAPPGPAGSPPPG
jgi:tetraacyldisaccharide 4'-kinase